MKKRRPEARRNGGLAGWDVAGGRGLARPAALCVAAMAIGLSGCVTFSNYGRDREMREEAEKTAIRQEFRRLEGRIEGLEMERDGLRRDLDALRDQLTRLSQSQTRLVQERFVELEQALKAGEAAREKDKQALAEQLGSQMAKLIEDLRKAQAETRHERGCWHDVKTGETLSEIATAYKVTVGVIIQANDLKDPDRVKVGQRLFIPQ
ncbi:MAG: LysM peptidoglycan-binding domain-containing protein [Kiritimatiellae bacterium]|nr:LysM peptidoglycan-binding domain-containing protein [Kiritimatiellia bacterium]